MESQAENLLNQAIQLSPSERVVLVDALLESLSEASTEPTQTMTPEVGRAWGEEVQRRMAEAESGRVKMIPADQALPEPKQDE